MKSICKHIIWFVLIWSNVLLTFTQDLYLIERLNINLWHTSEFSPTYFNNGIVFCSNKKNDLVITYTDQKNRSLTDLYYAELKEDFKFTKAEDFADELKSLHHDGPITFSSDGMYACFTRNYKTSRFIGNKIDPENKLGIFYAEKIEGVYANINLLNFCNPEHNFMHPSLTGDNKRIYYISDMPGGYGGFDVYYSNYSGGTWSAPINMGSSINTEKDEAFPYIHPSGRLYFASKGHPGAGRFDLYYTELVEGEWITPINMQSPFNTRFDDFGLIIDEDFESGYFSTARKRRQDDIYGFKSTFPEFDECPEVQENNYCFVFYETGSMVLDTTSLKYEWDLGDGTKKRGLEAEHCFDGPGKYMIQLNVIDTLTGDIYFSEASYLFNLEDLNQSYFIVPDTVSINEEFTLDGIQSYSKSFNVQNYYWNFGDGNRNTGRETKHFYRKPGEYVIKLGVTGDEEDPSQKLCNNRKIIVSKRK